MTPRSIASLLTSRSLHRDQTESSLLALALAFASGIAGIRLGANLWMVIDIAGRNGSVDWAQVGFWHSLFLVWLVVWTSPPRGVIAAAGQRNLGFAFAPGMRTILRRRTGLRSVLLHPSTVVMLLGTWGLTAVCIWFSRSETVAVSGGVPAAIGAVTAGLVVLLLTAGVTLMVAWISGQAGITPGTARAVQLLGLLILLGLFPDIGPGDHGVVTTLRMRALPSPVGPGYAIGVFGGIAPGAGRTVLWGSIHLLLVSLSPVVVPLVLSVGRRLIRRKTHRPVRFVIARLSSRLAVTSWTTLYVLLLPLLLSQSMRPEIRRWALGGWFVLGIIVGAGIVARADLVVGRWWNGTLAWPSRRAIVLRIVAAHFAVLLPGLIALIILI